MGSGNNSLVTLLEARYDYQSARAIAKEAAADAGLDAEAKSFSDGDIEKFIASLGNLGFDADAVSAPLGSGDAPAPAAAAAADDGGDGDDGSAKKDDDAPAAKPKAKAKGKKKK